MVATAPTGAARRILVAEDDETARVMLQRYLEAKGNNVVAVADGQACLDALSAVPAAAGAGDGAYDLVILDAMMPQLNGFEVLERARARGDLTPIIMATALARPDDIVRALELGADDYVTKPFSLPVLLARIDLRLRLRATIAPPVSTPPPAPPAPTDDAGDDVDDVEIVEEQVARAGDTGGFFSRLKAVAVKLRVAKPTFVELAKGTTIADRYVVGERIGEGGFGFVYRAHHKDLEHDVALKVMRAPADGAPQGQKAVAAFRREAQNACRMRHENAIRVFDFGLLPNVNHQAYLVMELLDGPTLEELILGNGKLELPRALPILRATLSALSYAHRQGIVHRDVKPHNVVLHRDLDREVPKLLDFGIATTIDDAGDNGVIVGSSAYIAPERLEGKPYDGRADVYACGIVLFRMLTGRLPFAFSDDDFEKTALWHMREHAPPTQVSPAADKVIARLLAKNPAERPDADEAGALVEQLIWE